MAQIVKCTEIQKRVTVQDFRSCSSVFPRMGPGPSVGVGILGCSGSSWKVAFAYNPCNAGPPVESSLLPTASPSRSMLCEVFYCLGYSDKGSSVESTCSGQSPTVQGADCASEGDVGGEIGDYVSEGDIGGEIGDSPLEDTLVFPRQEPWPAFSSTCASPRSEVTLMISL